MCRAQTKVVDLIALPDDDEPPPENDDEAEQPFELVKQAAMTSSKLRELIKILKACGTTGDGTRSLVFSQWTQHLDYIQYALEEAGISFTRLDGKMSRTRRESVLQEFRAPGGPDVLLLSLGAGALGLVRQARSGRG